MHVLSYMRNFSKKDTTMNILIISGHPALNESVANTIILDEMQKQLPEAHIR